MVSHAPTVITVPAAATVGVIVADTGVGVLLGVGELDGVMLGESEVEGVLLGVGELDGVMLGESEVEGVLLGVGELDGVMLVEGDTSANTCTAYKQL